jgi:hypothetical protein
MVAFSSVGVDSTGSNATVTVSASRSSHVSCCSMSFALGLSVLFEGARRSVAGGAVLRPRVEGGIS